MNSPRIERISWGKILIVGFGVFKDVRIFPGGCVEWDWNDTGVSHSKGVQIADIDFLLERGASEIVIGTGFTGRLTVPASTIDYMNEHDIFHHILKSNKAAEKYNLLHNQPGTAALIHSTC